MATAMTKTALVRQMAEKCELTNKQSAAFLDLLAGPADPEAEAARRLEMSTKDLLHLVLHGEIRYQMVDGIAHVPTDALEEYRAKAS